MGLSLVEAKRFLSTRAGFPATVALAGTSPVTTLPAPTIAFSPTVIPPSKVTPDPIEAPRLTRVTSQLQSSSLFQLAVAVGCAWITIVDESDAVPDKDVVFQGHAFTNKRVTRNLAARADSGVLLDLDKRSNLGLVANLTTIEVDETKDAHIAP